MRLNELLFFTRPGLMVVPQSFNMWHIHTHTIKYIHMDAYVKLSLLAHFLSMSLAFSDGYGWASQQGS